MICIYCSRDSTQYSQDCEWKLVVTNLCLSLRLKLLIFAGFWIRFIMIGILGSILSESAMLGFLVTCQSLKNPSLWCYTEMVGKP